MATKRVTKNVTKKKSKASSATKAKGASSRGRPSKIDGVDFDLHQRLCLAGCTDEQIAAALNIDRKTLQNWRDTHPELFPTEKDWKADSDARVEASLLSRACGYEVESTKIFLHEGQPVIVPYIEKYPPDPTSMIFWLKNRQPDRWRDKTVLEHDFSNGLADQLARAAERLKKNG